MDTHWIINWLDGMIESGKKDESRYKKENDMTLYSWSRGSNHSYRETKKAIEQLYPNK